VPLDRLLLLLFTANLATFGSGRLMVPILGHALVEEGGALTLDQFLFAFTVGRITPGPANLYVASIGWMLHGLPGALLAAAVVLLPGYLIIPLASGYRRLEGNGAVRGFGRGLIAASVGLLLASAIDIGRSALVSPVAAGVCALTLFLLHGLRWPALLSLAVGSAAGLALTRLLSGWPGWPG
jgi:chromate transporter